MVVPPLAAVLLLVLLGIPAAVSITRGRRARLSPWQIAAEGLQEAKLLPLFATFLLPLNNAAQLALFIVGLFLTVWSLSTTIRQYRQYRRSKASERPPTG